MIINNGVGTSNPLGIDPNYQAMVYGIARTSQEDATIKGNSFNVNTGIIGLTSTTESGVLYFKNDEAPVNGESSISVDAIAVGIGSGTTSGEAYITVISNPTAGTVISDETAVSINQNRNFGSPNTLDSLAYIGAEGKTLTGGNDFALLFQNAGAPRGFYPLDIVLPKGSSIGIKIDTQTTSGTTNIYVALLCHRIDGKNGI